MDDRFTWEEDDLEIEDPIGSGQFIPLREFNRRIAAEKAHEGSEKFTGSAQMKREKITRHTVKEGNEHEADSFNLLAD